MNGPIERALERDLQTIAPVAKGEAAPVATKFEVLDKPTLLAVLSRKADALLGMANASQIGDEREGLKFQAYAIKQAIGMLKDAK